MAKEKKNLSALSRGRIDEIIADLEKLYPDAVCALEYGGDPFRLLVMGRLSAQCTDARVNIVAKELFSRFPTVEDMAKAELSEIEAIVRPCGLYKRKASDIKASAIRLLTVCGGVLPSDMDELLSFPGVGRKIANLLRGDLFGLPAIVTDTHCIRICGRLGFYSEKEKRPLAVERILTSCIPPEKSSDFCHRIVLFGREYCTAQSPRCASCPLPCPRRQKKK